MSAGDDRRRSMVRALLTDGEKRAVRDDEDMDDNTKSSHLSRVRRKITRLEDDAETLREHRPEIYERLRASVCDRAIEARLSDLETRVEYLEAHHEGGQHPNSTNDNNIDNATDTTSM